MKNWVPCFVCVFFIKMLYRWFFYCKFYDFNRIWFRYSRVRNSRKKGVILHPLFRFVLGGFPVSRFFHIENVVVVGSKKVVKTDDNTFTSFPSSICRWRRNEACNAFSPKLQHFRGRQRIPPSPSRKLLPRRSWCQIGSSVWSKIWEMVLICFLKVSWTSLR